MEEKNPGERNRNDTGKRRCASERRADCAGLIKLT